MSLDAGRILAVVRKEFRALRRNRFIIGTMTVLPVIFLISPMIEIFRLSPGISEEVVQRLAGSTFLLLMIIPVVVPAAIVGEGGDQLVGDLGPAAHGAGVVSQCPRGTGHHLAVVDAAGGRQPPGRGPQSRALGVDDEQPHPGGDGPLGEPLRGGRLPGAGQAEQGHVLDDPIGESDVEGPAADRVNPQPHEAGWVEGGVRRWRGGGRRRPR